MAIHYASEPENGSSLVRTSLARVATRPSPISGRGIDFNALELSEPHAVYDLRADAVAGGGGLLAARHTGFRYLVSGGGAPVAAAEVLTDHSGAANLVANINYGPFVAATVRGLGTAAAHPAVAQGSYEARLLRFSAIGLIALWLKPDSGGADILFPLAPAPTGIEAEKPYSEAELLAAIRPLAERRTAKTDKASVP